ncbi:MAG TPA: rhomboid family intramembrane serine protease, partial [Terriglobales bacterium]|nr:rhomboid family intramembrane serine protease [Terriglobales bacterium]
RVDFERRMRRLPPVTLGVIVVLVAIFALELGLEILDSPEALLLVGALSRDAVMQGEWWRLVTAVFLHGGVEHVVGNAIALLVLGMVCEHAFGRVQFAWLFVMSGIAGSVLSMLATPGPSVGASGAIFGLQGAAVVLFRRHRERLLMRDRRIGVVLIVWALYTIATGLVTPYVDNGAHIGGFLGGALLARGLHPMVLEPPSEDTWARIRRRGWVTLAILIAAFLGWLFR